MGKVWINDFEMAYEKLGEQGKKLLLIHGNLASKRWWNRVKDELSQHFTLYMVDLRGCGDSSRPAKGYHITQYGDDLIAFMKEMKIETVTLIGHSMGGSIAMDVASKVPNQVEQLVLLNSAPVHGFVTSDEKLPLIEQYASNKALLHMSLSAVVPAAADQPFFLELVEDAWHAAFTAPYHARSLSHANYADWAKQFDKPVLVLHGEKDILVSLQDARNIANSFSMSRLITHPQVGHSPQVEDPAWFTQQLLQFLRVG